MPGRLVRVLVQPGQQVQAGEGLVVMEAMKMENELRAPRAGPGRGAPRARGPGGGDRGPAGRGGVRLPARRLLALALALALGGLLLARLPLWSAGVLSSRLQAFFHRPVTVGQVRYHLFPLEVEVLDLRVAGATPDAPPFLEVPRVVAAFSRPPLDPEVPQSFWDRKVVLSRLRIERPRLRVNAYEKGGDDIPAMGTAGEAAADARIERLIVERGEFVLNHERVPLDLDLPRFRGRLASRRPGVLGGTFSFGVGTARFGSAPAFPVGTDVELVLAGRRLTVESGRLRAPDTDLEYRGQIQLAARPQGQLTVRGAVDLAMLDAHVMRTGFGLRGRGRYDGTASVDGSRLRLKGRLEGTEGVFDGVPVPRYAGEVAWDSEGVHLRRFEVQALGGTGGPGRRGPARRRASPAWRRRCAAWTPRRSRGRSSTSAPPASAPPPRARWSFAGRAAASATCRAA